MPKKTCDIHLISDSTGETVSSVMRSVMTQFENVEVVEHIWPLVRTFGQLERVLESVQERPGPVLYTILDRDMQAMVIRSCRKMRVPCVAVLHPITKELQAYFGVEAKARPGKQHELDEEYFSKVDAIHYTLSHDDGQETETLDEADVILVGASRTSKTPTCVYLAYRGINAANVPFVKGVPLPDNLFSLKKPLIVGLVISSERLGQIRKSRLLSLHEKNETSYVDADEIVDELRESRKIFNKYKWPVIDVTRKSVEETCANILQLYADHKEKNELL
jgi:regulator of PEP synthase PpsR (kinase-PPPase family)